MNGGLPTSGGGGPSTKPSGPSARKARSRLLGLIANGGYSPREKLPGERELAAQVGVSRTVLREALAALECEGVVESSPWRGWFVAGPSATEHVALQSFTEMAVARGLRPGSTVASLTTRPATGDEAAALAIAPATPLVELVRVRTLNDIPTCIDRTLIAQAGVPDLDEQTLGGSLYAYLDARGLGVVRSDYRVRAGAASAETAEVLGLANGAPVLVGEEVATDSAGLPILLGQVVYRSESYEFRASLFRRAFQQ